MNGCLGSGGGGGTVSLSTSMTSMDNGNGCHVTATSDAEDDLDTEMVKLRPERPRLVWRDGGFQDNTMMALNHMRKNKHFCDVTLQVRRTYFQYYLVRSATHNTLE